MFSVYLHQKQNYLQKKYEGECFETSEEKMIIINRSLERYDEDGLLERIFALLVPFSFPVTLGGG